ncbi:uncharacterized protein BKA55DRAFT_393723 [Fusarium redolens]|uniref:Secreted protein n=1 Tax=Fusarium redolens TaxID=48865 RepID=A0A9P9K9F1_FUSRE|nr:uncharacterized protein BKA55DRAFT_393723 [Fusarium redolens]KAH7249011.1 hypothetical protein BKA55DRAFT_393723 [Fusarium redolens]
MFALGPLGLSLLGCELSSSLSQPQTHRTPWGTRKLQTLNNDAKINSSKESSKLMTNLPKYFCRLGSRSCISLRPLLNTPQKHKHKHKRFAVLFCTCMVLISTHATIASPKQKKSPPRKLSGELSPPSTSVWHRAACPFPRELQWSGITAPYLPACIECLGEDMTNCIRPESGLRNSHSHGALWIFSAFARTETTEFLR